MRTTGIGGKISNVPRSEKKILLVVQDVEHDLCVATNPNLITG